MPTRTIIVALTYGKKGDHDKAIADFTEAIRLNPNDAEAYYSRGCEYFEKGDHDRAIADFTEAIRLNPKLRHENRILFLDKAAENIFEAVG